jgi:hypothetical protein
MREKTPGETYRTRISGKEKLQGENNEAGYD